MVVKTDLHAGKVELSDLEKDPVTQWQHRHYFLIMLVFGTFRNERSHIESESYGYVSYGLRMHEYEILPARRSLDSDSSHKAFEQLKAHNLMEVSSERVCIKMPIFIFFNNSSDWHTPLNAFSVFLTVSALADDDTPTGTCDNKGLKICSIRVSFQ